MPTQTHVDDDYTTMNSNFIAVGMTALCLFTGNMTQASTKPVTLKIVETSDVHGAFFPYDFIRRQPKAGSLARVSSYVKGLRAQYGQNVILLDNGDILQGQPLTYYSNYVDTLSHNIAAEVVNYMKYDAQTVGNHDIETGHAVYDKWMSELNCPVVGANIVSASTGKPYVRPYACIERDGVKIAVLGMLTPATVSYTHLTLPTNREV